MSRSMVVSGGDYEHVLDFDNAQAAQGALHYAVTGLGDLSRIVLGGQQFDVAEYSLANYIMLRDRGDDRLSAIPVFPSRAFRNVSVFVPLDSPLHEVRQLAGRSVGVSDFAMTTAVWTRGHLHDESGLDWKDITWHTGASPRFPAPDGVRAQVTTDDLEDRLLAGEIDALMAGKPRDLQRPPGERRLRPLTADAHDTELRYFAATGLFPIMHTVVLHARVAQDRDAARRVFDTYTQTKKAALKRKLSASFLPFSDRAWDRFCAPGASDPYQHGLTDLNRRNVATLARYLLEQGLISRAPVIDTLFVPDSASWQDG